MKVLHIALRSLTFHSSVTHTVRASTNTGTNVGVTVADARVSAEEVERGFVSNGSKKTYHKKLAQFTFYLLDNKLEYFADGHCEKLQQKDEADKRRNAAATKPTKIVNQTYVREHLKVALKGIQPAHK